MFTLEIENGLEIALIESNFAAKYLEIVQEDRDYLSQWLVWPPHGHDEAFFLQFIKNSLHDYADGKSLVCGIICDRQLVGTISFNSIDHSLKKVVIGYWLRSSHQGNGIITKSVSKLIEYAFNSLSMEKIEISAAVENQSSRRVCERLGFDLEGIITRSENLNGRVVDHAMYGLNRQKWAKT